MSPMIVTLDGPAGVGKSTLARLVAKALRIPCLDTGAMFRFLALKLGPRLDDLTPEALERSAGKWRFSLIGSGDETILLANGSPLGEAIRTEEASRAASQLGQRPEARAILKAAQRALGQQSSLVAEGRDLGTVVFSNAPHKFFLDAKPEVRTMRRMLQLEQQGRRANYDDLLADINARDEADRNRATAPLRAAKDAVVIDTSELNVEQARDAILRHIAEKP